MKVIRGVWSGGLPVGRSKTAAAGNSVTRHNRWQRQPAEPAVNAVRAARVIGPAEGPTDWVIGPAWPD